MNTINNAAELSVSEILAGLLPVIAEEVKRAENNPQCAGSPTSKIYVAVDGVKTIYEKTSISKCITFSQIVAPVRRMAEATLSYYEAIGFVEHVQKLKAA